MTEVTVADLTPGSSYLYKYKTYKGDVVWCIGTYRSAFTAEGGEVCYEFRETLGLAPYTEPSLSKIFLLDAD